MNEPVLILTGDCREVLATLPDESVHCVVTSPPYFGLRDYGVAGQLGIEPTLGEHIETMVAVFREVRRVLRKDGTVWLNYGDCYNARRDGGHAGGKKGISRPEIAQQRSGANVDWLKPKDLCMVPNRLAIALQDAGWWVRSEIIWAKPNPMPESVTDRPTSAHEKIFLLTKSARYWYDAEAVKEVSITGDERMPTAAYPGKNDFRVGRRPKRQSVARGGFNGKTNALPGREAFRAMTEYRNIRNVWTVVTQPYSGAHFATFPPALVEPCIKAGCPEGGTVLDPFGGAGTVGLVADRLGRNAILIELNEDYAAMARKRIDTDAAKRGTGPAEIMAGNDLPLFETTP